MDTPLTTERVWELLSAQLRGFLRNRIADENLVADLLQETFLRVHQRLGDLQDEERLASWVFQIARNLAADHFRAAPGATAPAEPESVPDAGENRNDEVARWLRPLIDGLPEGSREAVRLYELDRLPQQAIADRLGLSLSGAKSRIQRGRERIKAQLEACCSFELDRRGNVLDYARRERRCAACCED
jgi:RNA polymerase sigma-70 factor (ECF subfamily)